jgi:ABC-type polysaccharide/polyol phosphate export permease
MLDYLRSIWRCRYFWMSLVKMDLRTRYRRSVLGLGWSLLHPLAMTTVLCVVLGSVLMPNMPILSFGPFLMVGISLWSYIVTSAVVGCSSMFQGESYIRQFPAPLAIYPLRTTLGATIHFLIALAVVIMIALVFRQFDPRGADSPLVRHPLALLSLLPSLVILFIFAWSVAVLTGFSNVFFQDTQHLCDVGFQILFYMTPVCYDADLLRGRRLGLLVDLNPLASFLDLVRQPILQGHVPALSAYLTAMVTAIVAAGCAAWTLSRKQHTLIFHL